MNADSTDEWLAGVATGDATAIERAVRAYEPVLRMMIRRQLSQELRANFDSTDIIQSVWGQLLSGFREGRWRFPSRGHLQAFLVRAARNRLIDRSRQQGGVDRRGVTPTGRPLDELPAPDEPAGAAIEAEELWERLWRACPEQHRPILVMKRQGLSLDEIAARSGLHKSSVRRLLYGLFGTMHAHTEPGTRT